jgi:hypothetical protein
MAGPALLATTLLVGSLALAADARKPSGTVVIDETQFAFIVGGSAGGGKLTFQGKEYPFKIGGLTVGANVGISKMSAAGEVYDLIEISKFPGPYTKLDVSITLGGGVSTVLKRDGGGGQEPKTRWSRDNPRTNGGKASHEPSRIPGR